MKTRNTLILLAAVALLAGYFFLIEQPRHRRAREEAAGASLLARFDHTRAGELHITRPDVWLVFRRGTGGWRMTSPLSDLADDGSVNRLVVLLSTAEIARDLGPQEDLSSFGLLAPSAAVTVIAADGDTAVSIDVGNLTVDKYHAYARRRGEASVLLVPTGVRRYALVELSGFRDKRMVDFDIAAVSHYTIYRPLGETTWRRGEDGAWFTESGGRPVRGRTREVEAILRRLRALRVAEFVPPAEVPAVRPFAGPTRSFEVSLEDGSVQELVIGRRLDANVYARSKLAPDVDERVVLTDTTVLTAFERSVDDLRDRRMLTVDRERIGRIELSSARTTVTVVRSGDRWGFPNPALGMIESKQMDALFRTLALLEFARVFDEDSSYELSNADVTLTMFDVDGSRIDRLTCQRKEDEPAVYLANSDHAGVIAECRAEDIDALVATFENLQRP